MEASENRDEDPADEPNESAWNEDAVEGQLEEIDDNPTDAQRGEEEAGDDPAME